MIIDNSHKIETNIKGSTEFSVSDDSAKIFSFLSNFLYKDKERSVITELCSNAVDAHKMVGKHDVAILVNLPTSLQPEFRVRDYGTGLSEEQVYKFLTKYGASSKGESNDFIGGFGIGSKSPAAVTDSWTINSHNSGNVTSYFIHINDKGIPSINKMFTRPTEESGLEVIVPTKSSSVWHDAAKRAFEYYEVMPTVKGSHHHFSQIKFKHSYKNLVKFTDNNRGMYSSSSAHVIMNSRSYELDLSKMKIAFPFVNAPFMNFEISSLSVSLSREDLQYDSKTMDAIMERYTSIMKQLSEDWKIEVSVAKNVYEYQLAAEKFKNTYLVTADAARKMALANADSFASLVDFSNLSSFTLDMNEVESFGQYIDAFKTNSLTKYRNGNPHSATKQYMSKQRVLTFHSKSKDDIVFILRDVKNAPSRIKNAIGLKKIPHAILLEQDWFDVVPNSFNKILASSLDKVVVSRQKIVKVKSELYIRDGRRFTTILESDLDKSIDIICVKFTSMATLDSIVDDFDRKFVLNTFSPNHGARLIFVKEKSDLPSFAITPKQWAEKKYNSLVAKKDAMADQYTKRSLKQMAYYTRTLFGKFVNNTSLFGSVNNTTVFGKFVEELNRLKAIPENLTNDGELDILNTCANIIGKPTVRIEAKTFREELNKAYPLLKHLMDTNVDDVSGVVDYIKMCGK